jgi:hypothetical protein
LRSVGRDFIGIAAALSELNSLPSRELDLYQKAFRTGSTTMQGRGR